MKLHRSQLLCYARHCYPQHTAFNALLPAKVDTLKTCNCNKSFFPLSSLVLSTVLYNVFLCKGFTNAIFIIRYSFQCNLQYADQFLQEKCWCHSKILNSLTVIETGSSAFLTILSITKPYLQATMSEILVLLIERMCR